MREIFEKALELEGKVTEMMGHCDIINIEVNATMSTIKERREKENVNVSDKFLAARYLELVDDLVRYGIVKKEW